MNIEEELWPGLMGYAMEHEGSVYIPLLMADKPGSGALTGYLDHMEALGKTLKIPNVLNLRLASYLERRGWVEVVEVSPEFGPVPVWMRESL